MIDQYINKTGRAMASIIDGFNDERRVVVALLALCFVVSFTTTYSGWVDLIGGWRAASFFELVFTFVLTAIIQLMIIWLSRRFWETRNAVWACPLSACVLVSVTMALACYFDILSLDKAHASNIYTGKLEQTLDAVGASAQRYQDMAKKTRELAEHSTQMARIEQRVGGTCDVPDIGRGPRTLFRENDHQQLSYYAKQFNNKSAELNRIRTTIPQDFGQYDGSNIILLNQQLHQFNAIATDKTDFNQLKSWLKQRITQGGIWFDTGAHQFGKIYISCPDQEIRRHYNEINNIKEEFFQKVPIIENITNPDTPGTQVLQSFEIIKSLFNLNGDKISHEQWIALFIAIIIDLIIFSLAYTIPKATPPPAGSSWNQYLRVLHDRKHGQAIDTLKMLSQYVSFGNRHVYFFIPASEKVLNMCMQPLISASKVKYRRRIMKWQVPFLVPAKIRQGHFCTFNQYRMSVHCVSELVTDLHRDNEQSADNASSLHAKADVSQGKASLNGSSLNGNSHPDLEPDTACNFDASDTDQRDKAKATRDLQ